jgi:hypothetical protein
MPGIRSKNSRVKRGFTPAYTPKMKREPTEEANIPLWQPNGEVRYVTQEDFQWLVDNKKIDLPKPDPIDSKKEANPPSSQ